ncbi:MAG TPA: electron transfer flavoprotein subunit alpha/FixB family protein [Acidimicrobiales bacterium]
MSDVAGVLCFVECDDDGVVDASLRALTFARSLAESSGGPLVAAAFGIVPSTVLESLSTFGVRDAHQLLLNGLEAYAPLGWARALHELVASTGVDALVVAGSDRGNEVLANLGATMGIPMVANCLSASWIDATSIRLSRQRWAGSLIEDAVLEGVPALLSVASDGVMASPAQAPVPTALHELQLDTNETDASVQVVEWIGRGGGVALADARVVVGGGRGVGSEEGFAALDELAGLLGAAVGVSRAVTSAGWRPHAQQVGQTGTRISAELYLACGISGATQHLAGCRSAKHVVTINTDADAPFLSRADYAVVGDLGVVIPALVSAIQARKSSH